MDTEMIYAAWLEVRGTKAEIEVIERLTGTDRNAVIDISTSLWRQYEREQRERH